MVVVVYNIPDDAEFIIPILLLFTHKGCDLGDTSDFDLKQIHGKKITNDN